MASAPSTLTIKDANGTNQTLPVRLDASGNEIVIHSNDSSIAHYRAGWTAAAPVATTPSVFALLVGSATTTTRVKKITVWGAATAAGGMPIVAEKCSATLTTGGTLTGCTAVPLDSGNAAASAVLSTVGTANITTVPTVVGIVGAGRIQFTALTTAATSGAGVPFVIDFTQNSSQALVLRGTQQCLTLSFKGATLASGGVTDGMVEWSEESLGVG